MLIGLLMLNCSISECLTSHALHSGGRRSGAPLWQFPCCCQFVSSLLPCPPPLIDFQWQQAARQGGPLRGGLASGQTTCCPPSCALCSRRRARRRTRWAGVVGSRETLLLLRRLRRAAQVAQADGARGACRASGVVCLEQAAPQPPLVRKTSRHHLTTPPLVFLATHRSRTSSLRPTPPARCPRPGCRRP